MASAGSQSRLAKAAGAEVSRESSQIKSRRPFWDVLQCEAHFEVKMPKTLSARALSEVAMLKNAGSCGSKDVSKPERCLATSGAEHF